MTEQVGVLFVREQAAGAWPNGDTVVKVNSQPDDTRPNGTRGQIVGSVDVRDQGKPAQFGYFVIWAGSQLPIFVADTNNDGTPRLERAP